VIDLTPSERKGALVLLALVALGAVADLLRLDPVPAPEPVVPAVTAPGPGAAAPARPPGSPPPPAVVPLDLNTATVAELDALPGIGPVLAGRIVSHRDMHGPYRATDDLLAVPGIGPRLLERLAPLVAARPPRDSGAPLQIARPTDR